MILYLCYAAVFVYKIAQKMYPLESDIIQAEQAVSSLVKNDEEVHDKKTAFEKLKRGVHPGILLIILTVFYIALVLVVELRNIEGKVLKPIKLGPTMNL